MVIMVREIGNKKVKNEYWHLFRHTTCGLFTQRFFATISQIDVKNLEIWWIFMHRENAEFWFTKFQNVWIHSLKRSTFKSRLAFLVSEKRVLRIWLWKNAGRGVYATPKFWHKIQDLQKSVEYLLNRPRLALTKTFLQLWDVLKLVYNTHSWP